MTQPEALRQAINEYLIIQHDIYGQPIRKILIDDDINNVVDYFMELVNETSNIWVRNV